VDAIVADGQQAIKQAMRDALAKGVPAMPRSRRYQHYLPRLAQFDTRQQADAQQITALFSGEDRK